jgi:hypothetical protein
MRTGRHFSSFTPRQYSAGMRPWQRLFKPTMLGVWVIAPMGLAVIHPDHAAAQSTVAITVNDQSQEIVNGLPVRVIALVRDLADGPSTSPRVVVAEASSKASLGPAARGSIMLEFEIVAPTVTKRAGWVPSCQKYDAAAVRRSLAALQAEVDALPIEKRREGIEALEIAASFSELRQAEIRDSLLLANHDPVMRYYRNEYLANATTSQLYQAENQQVGQAFTDFTASVGRSIDIYSAEVKAKYAVLAKDAARYKELTEASERSAALLRNQLFVIQREVIARRMYLQQVVSETERAFTGSSGDPLVTSEVTRTCADVPFVNDVIEFRAPDLQTSSTLVGELQFDAGGSEITLVRREKGTDRWLATFAWPAEASSAQLRVRALNSVNWISVPGRVSSGHASFTSLVALAADQAKDARKKYETALKRSKGSDHVKTLIIP